MTKPQRWPNNARLYRDAAAEELERAVRELRPLVVGSVQFDRTEQLRRFSAALAHVQTAMRYLIQAGAPVMVDEE